MVHEAVAAVLGPDVNPDEPLMASGLDSLGAVELRNALQAQIGSELPATLLFDYPSINAVTGFLAEQVGADHHLGGQWCFKSNNKHRLACSRPLIMRLPDRIDLTVLPNSCCRVSPTG
jgi:acyl carrier protein